MIWKKNSMIMYEFIFLISVILFFTSGCESTDTSKRKEQIESTYLLKQQTQNALPEINENSTIDDYLKYAKLNNPGLHAALNDWKATLAKIPQAKSFDDPTLTYNYMVRAENPDDDNSWDSIRLTQMFPFFGKRGLRKQVAIESAEVARQKYETEKRKLVLQVKNAYYDYYYQTRAIAVMKENLELIKAIDEVVRTRYKTAEAGYTDLLRVQVEIGKMEDEVSTMTDMLKPKVAQLNAILNRPEDSMVFVPKTLPEKKIDITEKEISSLLSSNNPEIAGMTYEVSMAEKSFRLANVESLPDFMLGIEYQAVMADAMEDRNPIMAMVGINIPLWRGKYRGMVDEAEAMLESAKGKLEEMKNRLHAELEMALYEYRDSERKILLYKDSLLPKAEQSLNSIQQSFASARSDYLDVIDALRTLLEFKLSYEKSLVNRAKSIAKIEMLVGNMSYTTANNAY